MFFKNVVAFLILLVILTGCQSNKQNPRDLKTQVDSVSYIIGMDFGGKLKSQKLELKPDVIAEGIRDALLDSAKFLIKEESAQKIFVDYEKQLAAKRSEKNKKDGDAFLDANKKKEGVITLPDGLQYRVLTMGTGAKPKAKDSVMVHYRVMTIDRHEMTSSYAHGGPQKWPVAGMFPGIAEALQLMPVGSKWELFVPPKLAFGEQGGPNGSGIEGNLVLIFEIDLLAKK